MSLTSLTASAHARSAAGGDACPFPRLRLRERASELIDLPWERPLATWPDPDGRFLDLPVGPSRHLVRFVATENGTYALKEEPLQVARREFAVLRRLERAALPSVVAVGLAELRERETAILVTRFLRHSVQYRRLLMRLPAGPGPDREPLLDAMASLLVDLHRSGVFWGDCSLANTLFRRDAGRIQAYLVDAETSEVHENLSDGQREHDLDILVENVAFGLADLAALQGREDGTDADDAIDSAERVRALYRALWSELHEAPEVSPRDRDEVDARVRRLNQLGFVVDEIELEPGPDSDRVRLRMAVTTRRYHARRLERLTGMSVLDDQARLLLNDLAEYGSRLERSSPRPVAREAAAARWLESVVRPTLARIAASVGEDRDLAQAYCDVLEHKWLLSERADRDVGLEPAIASYLALGAPAPEGHAHAGGHQISSGRPAA